MTVVYLIGCRDLVACLKLKMSWLFSKPKPVATDSTTDATIRAITEKHAYINDQRTAAMEKSEAYLVRAREIMSFSGQPNRGKRRMAAQLVRYSDRLAAHAESLCNVQMLLAEHLLALEERSITKGVVSMVSKATADLTSATAELNVTETLDDAAEALEEQHDSFQQLSREIENGPCPIDFLDDDRLSDRLFPKEAQAAAATNPSPAFESEKTNVVAPPPEYKMSPLQERLQSLQKVPTNEPGSAAASRAPLKRLETPF